MSADAAQSERQAAVLPDPDSPLYASYRRLGRATTFLAAASELLQLAKAFRDDELTAALRIVHGRSLQHLIEAQRQIGLIK